MLGAFLPRKGYGGLARRAAALTGTAGHAIILALAVCVTAIIRADEPSGAGGTVSRQGFRLAAVDEIGRSRSPLQRPRCAAPSYRPSGATWHGVAAACSCCSPVRWHSPPPPNCVTPPRTPAIEFARTPLDAKLAALAGRPVVINFWASWCEPCRDEMPALQQLGSRWREQHLAVPTVAVADTRGHG